ncbi:MAG: C-GCAxxG-C-C family protein [Candidatus Freyarchaeota archaeon]|nr:C-GCAxxG-C-C family protein [Candidatus Freyarchaeota archaeon]MDO8089441.1 C-GCAxxG-C-C family protein [Candidatus Sigynarchaeota archaeon]
MAESKEELLEKAFKLGVQYEKENTGCAQTVIAAIFDTLGIWNEDVFKAASGLADGLGLTGDGACGALVGGSMVISYLYPREKKDFKDMYKPMKAYAMVKQLHDQFVEKYGTCRCYDIQKRLMGRTYNLWDPKELEEAFKSGMMDHCSKVVGTGARLAVKIILEAREEEQK